jgi:hypothetical protein
MQWHIWLRHSATSWKVADSIADEFAANAVGKHLDVFAVGAISLSHINTRLLFCNHY